MKCADGGYRTSIEDHLLRPLLTAVGDLSIMYDTNTMLVLMHPHSGTDYSVSLCVWQVNEMCGPAPKLKT